MKYFAGLNLDGAFIQCSIVARDGTLICRDKIQNSEKKQFEEVVDDVKRLIDMLTQRANVELSGIGITKNNEKDRVACKNMRVFNAEKIADEVRKSVHAPVVFVEDLHTGGFDAAAFGG